MKNIHYAGDVLMTGDALADAVVKYAETLAQNNTSAAIDVPIVTEDGVATSASFLLGPASQLVAVPVPSEFPDPVDEALLARIEAERAKLGGVEAIAVDDQQDPPLDFDY
jgi:hypothetical protein